MVKEEIADDSTILPCFNGRVVSWLVTADGSNQSDNCSEIPHSEIDVRGLYYCIFCIKIYNFNFNLIAYIYN